MLCFSLERSLFFFSKKQTPKLLALFFIYFPSFAAGSTNQFLVKGEFWLQICMAAINNVSAENSGKEKCFFFSKLKSDLLPSSDLFPPFCSDFKFNDTFLERCPKTLQRFRASLANSVVLGNLLLLLLSFLALE